MKITFVLPFAGLSGGIRVVAIYAERLRKRGHDVLVVSLP
ncbi:MAG TPA: glycosyltransferase family 1 protein, partial [Cyanophyceae cyanobacterium]